MSGETRSAGGNEAAFRAKLAPKVGSAQIGVQRIACVRACVCEQEVGRGAKAQAGPTCDCKDGPGQRSPKRNEWLARGSMEEVA